MSKRRGHKKGKRSEWDKYSALLKATRDKNDREIKLEKWRKKMESKEGVTDLEMNELIMDFFLIEGEGEFCKAFMDDTNTPIEPRKSMKVRYISDSKKEKNKQLNQDINTINTSCESQYYGFDPKYGYYRNKQYLFNKVKIRGKIKKSILNGNVLNAIDLLNIHYKNVCV